MVDQPSYRVVVKGLVLDEATKAPLNFVARLENKLPIDIKKYSDGRAGQSTTVSVQNDGPQNFNGIEYSESGASVQCVANEACQVIQGFTIEGRLFQGMAISEDITYAFVPGPPRLELQTASIRFVVFFHVGQSFR